MEAAFGEEMSREQLVEAYYDPDLWMCFRWGVKCGPLSIYVYSHGVGWTWMCGPGHELRWRSL